MDRCFGLMALAVVGGAVPALPAAAQQAVAAADAPLPYFRDLPKWDPEYSPPRTPDGKPDFQGTWSSASLTTMTRTGAGSRYGGSGATGLVIPTEQIEALTADNYMNKIQEEEKLATPQDAPAGKPEEGRNLRGYNRYWVDPGEEYAKVNGEYRSSWIVSPADGQIPFSAAGRQARSARMDAYRGSTNTGPEIRPIAERCFLSYAGQAGPPLTNAIYNNNFEFVQTPESLLIHTEMIHDVRILRIDDDPRPDALKQWFGDSIARWEGDTLVVETRNFNPTQEGGSQIPISQQGKVVERFTRVSDLEIFYEFTVDDPTYYSETWKGEMPLRRSAERVYEYACHEGNYAMEGILRGMVVGLDTAIESEGE